MVRKEENKIRWEERKFQVRFEKERKTDRLKMDGK